MEELSRELMENCWATALEYKKRFILFLQANDGFRHLYANTVEEAKDIAETYVGAGWTLWAVHDLQGPRQAQFATKRYMAILDIA